jgi:dienelactone hydrolase
VSSAKAAIAEGQRLGVVATDRVAVIGYSYSAFVTANLLAHSNLFKAGIARSGAYNRTLTPYGFQGEEHTYWHAKGVYDAMSPFNFADKVKRLSFSFTVRPTTTQVRFPFRASPLRSSQGAGRHSTLRNVTRRVA